MFYIYLLYMRVLFFIGFLIIKIVIERVYIFFFIYFYFYLGFVRFFFNGSLLNLVF